MVLITGASGGLGSVLGASLAEGGFTVYGTMRDPRRSAPDAPFPMLPMEITDTASVDACLQEVVRREGRLDAVVNCVNQMLIGTVEEQTLEEVRSLYETNVFGVLRVCKAALPVMRRQGGGTIVNGRPPERTSGSRKEFRPAPRATECSNAWPATRGRADSRQTPSRRRSGSCSCGRGDRCACRWTGPARSPCSSDWRPRP